MIFFHMQTLGVEKVIRMPERVSTPDEEKQAVGVEMWWRSHEEAGLWISKQ